MSHVIIRFIGLCIHIRRDDFPALRPLHRVVFLSHDGQDIRDLTIDPHRPMLFTPKPVDPIACVVQTIGKESLMLNRVTLRVLNPRSTGLYRHVSYLDRLPHLTPPDQRLDPKDDVLLNGLPPASAYFDVDDGELHACNATDDGAVGTWLKVETDGDPIIEAACIDNTESQQWHFDDRSVIQIYNTSATGGDSDADYLINYQAFEPSSSKPPLPEPHNRGFELRSCFDPNETPAQQLELHASCSNTGFP